MSALKKDSRLRAAPVRPAPVANRAASAPSAKNRIGDVDAAFKRTMSKFPNTMARLAE